MEREHSSVHGGASDGGVWDGPGTGARCHCPKIGCSLLDRQPPPWATCCRSDLRRGANGCRAIPGDLGTRYPSVCRAQSTPVHPGAGPGSEHRVPRAGPWLERGSAPRTARGSERRYRSMLAHTVQTRCRLRCRWPVPRGHDGGGPGGGGVARRRGVATAWRRRGAGAPRGGGAGAAGKGRRRRGDGGGARPGRPPAVAAAAAAVAAAVVSGGGDARCSR